MKMKTKQFLQLAIPAIIMGAGFFVACDSDEQEVPAELTINNTVPATVSALAKTYYVEVTSNTAWTVEVNAEATGWCHVSPASGNGNAAITLTIDANNTAESRNATVTVSAGAKTETISFTQSESSGLDLDPTSTTVTASSAVLTIDISTSATWTARMTSGDAWCKITSTATGTGAGSITVSINENTTPTSRTAVVTFSVAGIQPKTTTIVQEASACTPPATFKVTASKASYCPDDEGATIGLENSETGITYVLYKNGSATTITATGTGAAVNFPGAQPAGTYTVRTEGSQVTCETAMSGSVAVTEIPPFNPGVVTSVAYTRASVSNPPRLEFSTPATGVSAYQWLKNGEPMDNSNFASFESLTSLGETSLTFKAQVKDACSASPDTWVDVPGEVTLAKVMSACPCAPTTVTFTGMGFISTTETPYGGNTWSDYAKAGNCAEGMFANGSPDGGGYALCRPSATAASLFTWCVVGLFSDELCPAGWHMPAKADFLALDAAVTEGAERSGKQRTQANDPTNFDADMAIYRNIWGANQSRHGHSNGELGYMGDMFWASEAGQSLRLTTGPGPNTGDDYMINPQKTRDKGNGLSVRCVKD
jgi:uncharacterized protein (TIGR02145 family)